MVNEKFVSMLFSDLKGFSHIKNDDFKTKLVNFLKIDILDRLLDSSNHFYFNTWGDAFYICSENPLALTELALQIRDKIKNKDWTRFGLNDDVEIRIALHAQITMVITEANGTVSNVTGQGVDRTARIEPVTKPNEVFCSEAFHQILLSESPRNIKSFPIGRTALAKNFGEMNLFRLGWASEANQPNLSTTKTPASSIPESSAFSPPVPKIRRKRTDREKADFIYQSFNILQQYFQNALNQLSKSNRDIEISFRPINNNKFVGEIYLDGGLKCSCKVWIGGMSFRDGGIKYAERHFSIEDDNSFNELLQVEDDGFEIFLRPTFNIKYGQTKDRMSAEEAAESLWTRFTEQLKY